jgi:hypothetical protein
MLRDSPGGNPGIACIAEFDVSLHCCPRKNMKLLFSGSDTAKIELVRQKLLNKHIACEIRRELATEGPDGIPGYPELWVVKDNDFDAAAHVLARLASPACK